MGTYFFKYNYINIGFMKARRKHFFCGLLILIIFLNNVVIVK